MSDIPSNNLSRRQFVGTAIAGAAAVASAAQAQSIIGEDKLGTGPAHSSAWQVGPKGDFDTMRLVQREIPRPGIGEVSIRVAASGIAGRDRAIARGWFLNDKPPSRIPLSEGVGTITSVGPGVTRVKVGERVTSVHFAEWTAGPWTPANYAADIGNTIDGWLANDIVLPASGLCIVPSAISNATAATLSGSALTAWHALNYVAKVRAGQTVLSLGTGGVSSWGVLLAKAAGARVVVTSSSDKKLKRMRELGADMTVNYRSVPNWGERISEMTDGRGVDIVLENVGRPTLDQSMLACANNAMLVLIGTGPLPEKLPKMPGLYIKNLSMKAISNGNREMMETLLQALVANDIQAVVDRQFPFDKAIDAFTYMDKSNHVGKVVIRHANA